MTIIVLLIIAGLAVWGVIATVLRLDTDGYGRPEIRDRNRHAETCPFVRSEPPQPPFRHV